jgi:hypothetical protein
MLSWKFQQLIRNVKEKLMTLKFKSVSILKNKYAWLTVSLIVLFISGFYANSYTARIVEVQKKAEEQASICGKNLDECEKNSTATQEQLTSCKSESTNILSNLTICTADKQQLESKYKNASLDLLNCQQTSSSLNTSYTSLKNDFDLLAKNAAVNICCKMKIDDPSIKYYYIDNDSIVCTAASSANTRELSCPNIT